MASPATCRRQPRAVDQALRDAGRTVKFSCRVNHRPRGADLTLSQQRSAAEGLSHSFHPNWICQWPNKLEFGFEP